MKVLICGSRNFTNEEQIKKIIISLPMDAVIIEGGASGADKIACELAKERGLKVEEYLANWEKFGRSAGPVRNMQMLKEGKPDIVYAFYTDKSKSKGTINMVNQALQAGIKVIEYDAK